MSRRQYTGKPILLLLALLLGASPVSAWGQTHSDSADQAGTLNAGLLSGNWSGDWSSCKSGHNGRLRATFCRISETQVQARFNGTFCKIFPFRYNAVLQIVHEEEGLIQLKGSRKLGPLMGTFRYEATITGNDFRATYRSKRDCGQWNMTRDSCR
ncbi:MAG: hypothetical protein VYE64_05695 [Planctomycetota bacterium]|nr:hypothetical protein [Planctomycetota bacterium]